MLERTFQGAVKGKEKKKSLHHERTELPEPIDELTRGELAASLCTPMRSHMRFDQCCVLYADIKCAPACGHRSGNLSRALNIHIDLGSRRGNNVRYTDAGGHGPGARLHYCTAPLWDGVVLAFSQVSFYLYCRLVCNKNRKNQCREKKAKPGTCIPLR